MEQFTITETFEKSAEKVRMKFGRKPKFGKSMEKVPIQFGCKPKVRMNTQTKSRQAKSRRSKLSGVQVQVKSSQEDEGQTSPVCGKIPTKQTQTKITKKTWNELGSSSEKHGQSMEQIRIQLGKARKSSDQARTQTKARKKYEKKFGPSSDTARKSMEQARTQLGKARKKFR